MEQGYSSTHSYSQNQKEVNGRFHAPPAKPRGNIRRLPLNRILGWGQALTGVEPRIFQPTSIVATPTVPFRIILMCERVRIWEEKVGVCVKPQSGTDLDLNKITNSFNEDILDSGRQFTRVAPKINCRPSPLKCGTVPVTLRVAYTTVGCCHVKDLDVLISLDQSRRLRNFLI